MQKWLILSTSRILLKKLPSVDAGKRTMYVFEWNTIEDILVDLLDMAKEHFYSVNRWIDSHCVVIICSTSYRIKLQIESHLDWIKYSSSVKFVGFYDKIEKNILNSFMCFSLQNHIHHLMHLYFRFQWPYCDGSHATHNKECSDNLGPLVLKRNPDKKWTVHKINIDHFRRKCFCKYFMCTFWPDDTVFYRPIQNNKRTIFKIKTNSAFH